MEIKKAFRKLALETHPDRNPNKSGAEERFKRIGEAYRVLIDPQRRKVYNQVHPVKPANNLNEIFRKPFGGGVRVASEAYVFSTIKYGLRYNKAQLIELTDSLVNSYEVPGTDPRTIKISYILEAHPDWIACVADDIIRLRGKNPYEIVYEKWLKTLLSITPHAIKPRPFVERLERLHRLCGSNFDRIVDRRPNGQEALKADAHELFSDILRALKVSPGLMTEPSHPTAGKLSTTIADTLNALEANYGAHFASVDSFRLLLRISGCESTKGSNDFKSAATATVKRAVLNPLLRLNRFFHRQRPGAPDKG